MGFLDRLVRNPGEALSSLRGRPRSERAAEYVDDPAVPDDEWLVAGERRYDSQISNHYGSPETIARGGQLALQREDVACALFFFQKAIDLLHTLYDHGGMQRRRPGPADDPIIDSYLGTLSEVRARRPQAPVKASVLEVTHRLRTISTACKEAGLDPGRYLAALERLGKVAPDVDVSGTFWKNPSMEEVLGPDWRDRLR